VIKLEAPQSVMALEYATRQSEHLGKISIIKPRTDEYLLAKVLALLHGEETVFELQFFI
jgi:hypothetical protein